MGTPRHIQPLALRDTNAAKVLDMPTAKFRDLVKKGAMPPPVVLADGIERWRMSDLAAILDGTAARPDEDIEV
ncbi:hypothetical protein [Roseovarius sp.]|uniref:hypothetical protein n=1 Tax=Roseovarius sp. TaxID=1486281 RepID=UPI003BAB0771